MNDSDRTQPGFKRAPPGYQPRLSSEPPPSGDLPMPLATSDLRDHVHELHQDLRAQADINAAHFHKISIRLNEQTAATAAIGAELHAVHRVVERAHRIDRWVIAVLVFAIFALLLLRMYGLIGV